MRCANYIRVSSDREEQKSSIQNQRLAIQQYISKNHWTTAGEYIDIESGTTSKRDDFQRLLEDIKQNKFDVILAKDLSRLARNGAVAYSLREIATYHGVRIITVDGMIDTGDEYCSAFGMQTWVSEYEAARTSERTKIALRSRAQAGHFMGSIPPFGYLIQDKKLVLREDYSPHVVRRIFQDYLSGLGCDKIAHNLTSEKIPTPRETSCNSNATHYWHGSTIKLILQNHHYTGDLVQGKETTISVTCKKRKKIDEENFIIVPNTHEPIISKEMFDAVQLMLKNRKKNRPASQVHLFSNLLFCKDCRKGMHYRAERKGYICGTYSKKGKEYCTSHVVKESALSSAILDDINQLLKDATINCSISDLKKYIKREVSTLTKYNRSLQKQLKQIQSENNSALKKLVKGNITNEQYTTFISLDSQSTQPLEAKLYSNNLVITELSDSATLERLHQLIHQRNVSELTHTILNLFIERIEIQDSQHIDVYYKFKN